MRYSQFGQDEYIKNAFFKNISKGISHQMIIYTKN